MGTKDLVIAPRTVEIKSYLPLPGLAPEREATLIRAAARVGEAKRSMSRFLHDLRYRPPRARTAKMLVLIPAHNEEMTIGKTLNALLTQTRVPDRIVVIADNCTDRTEQIAGRYRGVTVMRTVGNTDRKVGALNQGWLRWQAGYDYIAGIDADTVLAPDCLHQLEAEMASTPKAGGVMARYTFDQHFGTSAMARLLIRLQRIEFASWTADALRRNRKTYVLGGQASLFSAKALREVAERNRTREPWDATAQVEDMQLTGDLQAMRYATNVSTTARAYAGPMVTLRSLWHQRRKWDEGMIRLLVRSTVNKWTAALWRQQLSLLSNGLTRLGFLFMLTAALMVHQYVWSWWWAAPPAIAALLNFKIAWRVPNRTASDLLTAMLLVPVEIYLVVRVACATASWVNVLAGIKRDGWAHQARAEQGRSSGPGKMLGALLLVALLAGGAVAGWTRCPLFIQQRTLTVGWGVLAAVTALQTFIMIIRIFRPSRGLRP
ncbi:MAG TPA: glycosyltransferase family 2 protein [Streptosporangiaceae bacterium]|jgi:cellulose synthase/poly-beta-1,6-N-acetylglucosamine synthase-like glycosyltransferase